MYCIVLYCIVLYYIILYCIVSYDIILYCIVLYCIILYYIILYYIILYCIILYYIIIYHTIFIIYIGGFIIIFFSIPADTDPPPPQSAGRCEQRRLRLPRQVVETAPSPASSASSYDVTYSGAGVRGANLNDRPEAF